jgi:site-specific recombinase XerD
LKPPCLIDLAPLDNSGSDVAFAVPTLSIFSRLHSFASRLVMGGVDLYTVSKLFGHHDVKMTTRYAYLSPEHLLSAVGVLDKVPVLLC